MGKCMLVVIIFWEENDKAKKCEVLNFFFYSNFLTNSRYACIAPVTTLPSCEVNKLKVSLNKLSSFSGKSHKMMWRRAKLTCERTKCGEEINILIMLAIFRSFSLEG